MRTEELGKLKNSPHRVSNPRPSGLEHSAVIIIIIIIIIIIKIITTTIIRMCLVSEFVVLIWIS
jgi:hypothetical protein